MELEIPRKGLLSSCGWVSILISVNLPIFSIESTLHAIRYKQIKSSLCLEFPRGDEI